MIIVLYVTKSWLSHVFGADLVRFLQNAAHTKTNLTIEKTETDPINVRSHFKPHILFLIARVTLQTGDMKHCAQTSSAT